MGIVVTTDDRGVKVWRNDDHGFPQYAIAVSQKQDNGEHIRAYQAVRFRRGVELSNGDEIFIQHAFPTLNVWSDRRTGEQRKRIVLMIDEFTFRDHDRRAGQADPRTNAGEGYAPQNGTQMRMESQMQPETAVAGFSAIEDDLPF